MSIRTLRFEPGWQWRRVAASIGSVSTHLVVGALLLLPIAEPLLERTRAARPPTLVELREQTPPLPSPPEPTPPPRSRPARAKVPPTAPRIDVAPAIAASTSPILSMPAAAVAAPVAASATPASVGASSGESATQTLAYAGALRTVYPPASARAREQGKVLLRVLVDATGAVEDVRIERSSGHARLDAAARDAVLRGRFRPVIRDGEPVSAWGLVPIEFRLDPA